MSKSSTRRLREKAGALPSGNDHRQDAAPSPAQPSPLRALLLLILAGGLTVLLSGALPRDGFFGHLIGTAPRASAQPSAVASSSSSAASWPASYISAHNSGGWAACPPGKLEGTVCGYIKVPKDYTDSSAGFAEVAVAKLPASVPASERLGTIFLNPGGPGGAGTELLFGFGGKLHQLFEGKYDLLGFDPRGIGSTRPLVNCFGDAQQLSIFKKGTIQQDGYALPPNPFSNEGKAHLLRQIKELTALQETEFKRCAAAMGDELRHMSTPTVVRDIDHMSKLLDGPDGKINYIGFSYGTLLGAYLVNMLPAHRLGRVLIDGVASAPSWANEPSHKWLRGWLNNTDTAYNWFMNSCSEAGPNVCRLAKHKGEAPKDIKHRLDVYLEKLYYEPLAVPEAIRPGVLTSAMARTVLYFSTNSPHTWPRISDAFADALDGNPTKLYSFLHGPLPPRTDLEQTDLSRAAVVCGDQVPLKKAPSAEDLLDEMLYNLEHTNRRFSASIGPIESDGGCQFHPAYGRTPERFNGPWNATLDTPILIVSNTADPITPRNSGEEIHKLMGSSSRIIIQDSPGHCSLSSASPCTLAKYAAYFVNGTLPENHSMCGVVDSYFPTEDREALVAQRVSALSAHEQRFVELSKSMTRSFSGMLADQLPGGPDALLL